MFMALRIIAKKTIVYVWKAMMENFANFVNHLLVDNAW